MALFGPPEASGGLRTPPSTTGGFQSSEVEREMRRGGGQELGGLGECCRGSMAAVEIHQPCVRVLQHVQDKSVVSRLLDLSFCHPPLGSMGTSGLAGSLSIPRCSTWLLSFPSDQAWRLAAFSTWPATASNRRGFSSAAAASASAFAAVLRSPMKNRPAAGGSPAEQ